MPAKNFAADRRDLSEARSRLGLAVIELYALNEEDKNSIWKSYHDNYAKFFQACMLGDAGFTPSRNKVQKQIADVPGETMNLYVGIFDCYSPSHGITLVRDNDGLWKLQKPTVRAVSKSPADGVLAVVTLHNYGGGVRTWIPLS